MDYTYTLKNQILSLGGDTFVTVHWKEILVPINKKLRFYLIRWRMFCKNVDTNNTLKKYNHNSVPPI